MTDLLLQAYFPLFLWVGLGVFSLRILPASLPRLLGRGLYWVGVPLEIFALARQANFGDRIGLTPAITLMTLLGGLAIAWCTLQLLQRFSDPVLVTLPDPQLSIEPHQTERVVEGHGLEPQVKAQLSISPLTEGLASHTLPKDLPNHWYERHRQGSFLIASILGNTGFVGLAVAPTFISAANQSWLVFYSVTQNVFGIYTLGVLISSYFGRTAEKNHWSVQLRDVLTVPSSWGFVLSMSLRSIEFPVAIETALQAAIWVVIPASLLLMGMRLSQIQGWKSLRLAIVPAILKALVMPIVLGLVLRLIHFPGEPRLALVLMSGMPSAFAGLILAEEYDLDRDLIASSILWTTGGLFVTVPVWLWLFAS